MTQVKGSKLAHDFWKKYGHVYDGQEIIRYDRDGNIFQEVVKMLENGGHYLPRENEKDFMREVKDLGVDCLIKRGPSLPNELYNYIREPP